MNRLAKAAEGLKGKIAFYGVLSEPSLACVVGHLDWRVQNLAFADGAVSAIYDWDSIGLVPEAAESGGKQRLVVPEVGLIENLLEGLSAGGVGGASFILDMAEERVLMQEAGRGMLPAHGLTIAQFAYSIGMFTAILLVVTTVVIGLIIYTMTLDKKKAIATLKLIGAPDSVIVKLVLQQALALGGIGFVLGAAFIRLAKDFFPRRLVFEPSDTALLFCVVAAVALLASVIGIRTALKIDPASALSG